MGSFPAEGTCTACHTGNPVNTGGSVTVLDAPAVYKPDSTYLLTIQLASTQTSAATSRRWGFQVTAINATTGAGYGTLVRSDEDSAVTVITDGSGSYTGRRYLEQIGTGTRTGIATPVTWKFRWIAPSPSQATAPVSFYVAGNAANGSGSSGDWIYTGSITAGQPGRISTASSLEFGTVIVGGVAEQTLQVGNVFGAPAGPLDYSFNAPAGFTAPLGTFSAAAGAAPNDHTVGMDTSTPGDKSDVLVVASSDPVNPNTGVDVIGTVLAHADPSLDSTVVVLADTLDFGTQPTGGFLDSAAVVANFGFSGGFQSQLQVTAAVITGGDGRFTIPGGFTPVTLGALASGIPLRFDDSGATLDSTYTATLTISSTDESLPGGTDRPDLVLTLTARSLGPVGITPMDLPSATRLLPAAPNPAFGRATLSFDLAQRGTVSFALYDARGRRVRTVADGAFEPGRHRFTWDARDDGGARVAPGVYFYRMTAPGFEGKGRIALIE